MKKILSVAILSAFSVALVTETVLFALGKVSDLGTLAELGVAWGIVLIFFIAGVLRIAFGRTGGIGVVVVHRYEEPEEDEDSDSEEDDEPEENEDSEEDEEPEEDEDSTTSRD